MDTPTGRPAAFAARASVLVVLVTFVALLGGLHPPDHDRDAALAAAAVLFAALNLPSVLAFARARSGRAAALGLLLARVAFAVVTLRFVHGISHEGRHDAWRACRARIRVGGPQRCAFLHLCAHEAPLSADERARLLGLIRATPGCADP